MSAKSKFGKPKKKNKTPFRRSPRSRQFLLATVVLIMAAGTWITTYTAKAPVGEAQATEETKSASNP